MSKPEKRQEAIGEDGERKRPPAIDPKRLREARLAMGLSMNQLDELVGTRGQTSRLESGKRGGDTETLWKYAKALGVTQPWLHGDRGAPMRDTPTSEIRPTFWETVNYGENQKRWTGAAVDAAKAIYEAGQYPPPGKSWKELIDEIQRVLDGISG